MPLKKGSFIKDDALAGIAIFNNCIISDRKVRMIANIIRNENVNKALAILNCNQKSCVRDIKKLLLNAVTNLETKCEKLKVNLFNTNELYISTINVDSASMIKRTLPAPHGRAFRINKRRSHIVIVVKPENKNIEKINTKENSTNESNTTTNKKKEKELDENIKKNTPEKTKNNKNLTNKVNLKDKNNNNKKENGTESKSN